MAFRKISFLRKPGHGDLQTEIPKVLSVCILPDVLPNHSQDQHCIIFHYLIELLLWRYPVLHGDLWRVHTVFL